MNHWALFKLSFARMWHPALWVFGLIAALSGGGFNFHFGSTQPLTDLPLGTRELLGNIIKSVNVPALIAAGVILGIVAFIFNAFSQGALISLIYAREDNQSISLGKGIDGGGRRILPLLAVRILLALPTLILGAIAAGSFLSAFSGFFTDTQSNTSLFDMSGLQTAIGLSGVIFVISLLTSAISVGAERAVVLDDLPVFAALARGWKLIWSKFADFFAIGLLFIGVFIVSGLLFACVLIPLFAGGLFAGLFANLGSLRSGANPAVVGAQLAGPAAIAVVILGLLFGTLVSIFISSVWTLAYRVWQADFIRSENALQA